MTSTRTHDDDIATSADPAATDTRPSPPSWLALIGFVAVAQAAGFAGIPFTDREPGGWYDRLDKPPFNPPSWVFGPVWTTLYLLIGIGAWLVWRTRPSGARTAALAAWAVQLVLNAAWTPLYFGAHQLEVALVEIVAMLAAIGLTISRFARVDRRAAALLVPYAAWVSFATVLNAAFVVLN